ncbi:hypothetical protein [Okeania sp. SIO3I5]|uniref:hypothetical protein n=1 Tax=Okeania sp. SIO3I5 TaxID=2607805 RepID=UPI0025DD94CE|nr:hypothetical protein [Okeania sp. SIO3I5]
MKLRLFFCSGIFLILTAVCNLSSPTICQNAVVPTQEREQDNTLCTDAPTETKEQLIESLIALGILLLEDKFDNSKRRVLRIRKITAQAFFATFVLNIEIVQQIIRWDMAVLQESPWYQQILQERIQIGEQRGEQRGIEIGLQRGILSGIKLGLELKFGELGKEIFSEINTIENIQVLETILASLKTVETIDKLRQIYLK